MRRFLSILCLLLPILAAAQVGIEPVEREKLGSGWGTGPRFVRIIIPGPNMVVSQFVQLEIHYAATGETNSRVQLVILDAGNNVVRVIAGPTCPDGCEIGIWPPCINTKSQLAPLADGNYTFRAELLKQSGGQEEVLEFDEVPFVVDNTLPVANAFILNPKTCYNASDDFLEYQGTANDLHCIRRWHWELDDVRITPIRGPENDCPFTTPVGVLDLTTLSDGGHRLKLVVQDQAGFDPEELCRSPGNISFGVVDFIVDRTPPTAVVVAPQDGQCLRNPVTIEFTVADSLVGSLAKCEVVIDEVVLQTIAPCPQGPHTAGPFTLSEGYHTVEIRVVDACGNAAASAPVTFKVDDTPPTLTVTAPSDGQCVRNPVTVSYTVADNIPDPLRYCEMWIDGVKVQTKAPCMQGAHTFGPVTLSEGTHTVFVRAEDDCQHIGTSATVTFKVDDTPPTATIEAPADGQCLTGQVSVRFTVSDNLPGPLKRCEVLIDGVVVHIQAPCLQGSHTVGPFALPDGDHTVQVRVTDDCDNVGTSARITFKVDNTPPTARVDAPAEGQCVRSPVTIRYTVADNLPGPLPICELLVDGVVVKTHVPCPQGSYEHTMALADGPHTVQVRVKDDCEHVGTSTLINFKVDNTPPSATVTAPQNGQCTGKSVTVRYSVSDNLPGPLKKCELLIDGVVVKTDAPCPQGDYVAGPFNLTDGPHTVQVRVTDDCDNSGLSALVTFTVDDTPPAVRVDAPTEGECTGRSVTVTYTVSDNLPGPLKRCEVLIDGVVVHTDAPCNQGTHTVGPFTLSDGPHTVQVRAVDDCDNVGSSGTVRFTVDETPPSARVDAPTEGQCVKSPVSVTYTVSDNLPGPLKRCEVLIDGVVVHTDAPCNQGTHTVGPFVLSDGPHTVQVRAVDDCDNVGTSARVDFKVDNTPPAATVTAPQDGECVRNPVSISYSVSDNLLGPLKKCELLIDGVVVKTDAPCPQGNYTAGPFTLGEGPHAVQVRVTDDCDNVGTSAAVTFKVDDTPPTVRVDAPTEGQCVKSPVSVTYTVSDNLPGPLKRCEVLIDGVVVHTDAPCNQGTHTVGPFTLSDGPHTVQVRAVDDCDNVGTSARVDFKVDNTPPSARVDAPTEGQCVKSPVPVTYTVSDNLPGPLKRCEVLIDGVVVHTDAPCNQGTHTVGPFVLADGPHTVQVRAVDDCDNVGTSARVDFKVDNTPPSATVTAPQNGQCTGKSVTVRYSVSDNLPGPLRKCELLIDGVVVKTDAPCPQGDYVAGPFNLTDGPHTVQVRVTDDCDNVGSSALVTFTVDDTPPTVRVDAPTEGQCVKSPVSVTYTVSDNLPGPLKRCEVLIDGVVVHTDAPCNQGTHTVGPFVLADGPHTVQVRAVDDCDNVGTSALVNFKVDNTPPAATVTAPQDGECVRNPVSISYSVSDNLLGPLKKCELLIDGVVVKTDAPCPQGNYTAGPFTLGEGPHAVQVRVTDDCDNVGTSAAVTFKVDDTPPTVRVDAPTEGQCVKSPVSVTYTVSDNLPGPLKRCEVLIDGVVVHTDAPCNQGTHTVGPFTLSDGPHTVQVRAVDDCDNVGTSARVDFKVDNTPPSARVDAPTEGQCVKSPVPVTYTVSDNLPGPLKRCEVLIDGVVVHTDAPCNQGTHTVGPFVLADGPHTVQVRAVDDCDNVGTSARVDFKVDNTPPSATVTAPQNGQCTGKSVTVRYSVSDNLPGPLRKCELLIDGVVVKTDAPCPQGDYVAGPFNLTDGPHTVQVRVTDDCDNVGSSALVTFTVDDTPPTVRVDAPTEGQCVKSPVSVTYTVSDNLPGPLKRCEVLIDGVVVHTDAPCNQGTHTVGPFVLADGPHTVQVRAVDDCDNVGTSALVNFKVDNTPPSARVDAPTEGQCVKSPVSVTYTVSDNLPGPLKRCEVLIDGVVVHTDAPCNQGTHTVGPFVLADGPHTVQVRAVDDCDNVGTSALVNFKVDNTPPSARVDLPTEGQCTGRQVSVTFTASDNLPGPLKRCEVLIDGVVVHTDAPCPQGTRTVGPFTLSDGPHTVQVRVTDECDNVGVSAIVNFKVDETPPSVDITAPSGDCISSPVTVDFTVADNLSGNLTVRLFLNGVLRDTFPNLPQGSHTAGPYVLAQGSYVIRVEAVDACGNVGSDEVRTTIDTTAPNCTLLTPEGCQKTSPVTATWTATDNCSGFRWVLTLIPEGGAPVEVARGTDADPFSATLPLADGRYTLRLQVTDDAGNVCVSNKSFTVDTTRPEITVITPPVPPQGQCTEVKGLEIPIQFSISDLTNVTWYVTVDASTAGLTPSSGTGSNGSVVWNTEGFALGQHTICIRAVDECGNETTVCYCVDLLPLECPPIEVPNLICGDLAIDPVDGVLRRMFRPEVINVDGITIWDVLRCNGQPLDEMILQAVRIRKVSPLYKCGAFVFGPGSGLNTNFDSGLKRATNADLYRSICSIAFGTGSGTCLGDRSVLFSPPYTTYNLSVTFVRRLPDGRISPPETVDLEVIVNGERWLTRDLIRCNIEYFSTVAAGRTQIPKISTDVAAALYAALDIPNDLDALIQFETVVGMSAIDFVQLLAQGDVRGKRGYLVDSDEEPIGCLLIEMANALLFHP